VAQIQMRRQPLALRSATAHPAMLKTLGHGKL
jgi:hypothetical protein